MRLGIAGLCAALPTISLLAHAALTRPENRYSPKPAYTQGTESSKTLAERFAAELKRCSPPSNPKDMVARDRCSDALRTSKIVRDSMNESILWGGRPNDGITYNPKTYSLTMFGSYVYSALYLSLFTFTGQHTITENEGYVVLHAACQFRGDMETGAYPYPFWHKPSKWLDYQTCKNIDFVFEKGKIIAAYRSIEKREDAKIVHHDFDGKWTWTDSKGKTMPSVALFDYLLSSANPHRGELDKAYRDFALESRKHGCMDCHSPANPTSMKCLAMLSYPNQALGARHEILQDIIGNVMPPKAKNHESGIADTAERKRMLLLAKRFAEVGDKALQYENRRSEMAQ